MTGRVVHFEIPTDDPERASGFYSSVFGWQTQAMPEMEYTMVTTAPTDADGRPAEPGSINGGMFRREEKLRTPMVTLEVEDIDAALDKVASAGGSTVSPREPVGDMGFAAYFRDSEGNVLGLWENAAPAGTEAT